MELVVIQQKIFEIRNQKVMMDFDLAKLYKVETKRLKEAVKRNRKRFPPDFMFELTKEEWINLRTQFASSSWGGLRYMPYAFTEHGVTMLASILNSDRAIKMNIDIVRAFVSLRQMSIQYKDLTSQLVQLKKDLYQRIGEHDVQLSSIYDAIEDLLDDKTRKKKWDQRERIGFKK